MNNQGSLKTGRSLLGLCITIVMVQSASISAILYCNDCGKIVEVFIINLWEFCFANAIESLCSDREFICETFL